VAFDVRVPVEEAVELRDRIASATSGRAEVNEGPANERAGSERSERHAEAAAEPERVRVGERTSGSRAVAKRPRLLEPGTK